MLTLVLLLIFIIVAGALWFQGLWSNVITLINFLLAGLLSFNYFEPVASMIVKSQPSYTYVVDFVVLWAIFAASFGLLRLFTDIASRKRVAFPFLVETIGRSVLALWVAWLFVGFVCASLHTAPLGPHPMGFQQTPAAGNFLGMAPGKQWLALIQSRSRGTFSRSESDPKMKSPLEADKNLNVRMFDPESKFILKYYQRRADFAGVDGYRASR